MTELDGGTYEVLRTRLAEHASELARRAETLNERRVEVFGGAELALLGTERIRTENNCVPRDIVALSWGPDGGRMLFGYNVFIGLKNETRVSDVFSVFTYRSDGDQLHFEPSDLDVLSDERFEREFAELYRYYRDTRLMQLRRTDRSLLAVFQTGPDAADTRVLRWRLDPSGALEYVDNRGDREHTFPPSHDFEWVETSREQHVKGRYPHVSIEDEVFVETLGGNLTIKVENNTETGEGIYSEPVDEPLQSLADAEVHYARVGPLILLRVRPYNETQWRHLVFNTRTHNVMRLDGIGQACRQLPEDHGIIFPGGYYLATGEARTFDADVSDLEYLRLIKSPNGEDVLYVFYAREAGRTLLLPYNVIRKEVDTPITCHGYSLFDDGTLIVFRATSDEPTRVHPMQVWRTPFISDTYAAAQSTGTGPLERVGNADLVRGISDALSVNRMISEMEPSASVFEAIIAACGRMTDHYHWLGDESLGALAEPLAKARKAAEQVLAEFENVQALTAQAVSALDQAESEITSLIRRVRGEAPRSAGEWVRQLAALNRAQGHLVTLREMRYADSGRIDELASSLDGEIGAAAGRAVAYLERDDAFDSYHEEVERLTEEAARIRTVAEAEPVDQNITEQSEALGVVTDIVGTLDIADATVRTGILERISEMLAGVNRARATLRTRRRELLETEGRATFAAEFALLGHEVSSALALADTPEACDEQLGRLMLTLENLEARFGDFDEFIEQLETKRTDVYEAFSARKQSLVDERERRAARLAESAERILSSVRRRAANLESLDEVNTYFASDPMVAKIRALSDELRELDDQVRAEELDGRIKAARQEAGRALRDQVELYDGDAIRLGRHRFAVNSQPIELTMVPDQDGEMAFSITGTDYRSVIADESFAQTRPFWGQLLVSETAEVYRAEYLAASVLMSAVSGGGSSTLEELHEAAVEDGGLLKIVRDAAEERYDEGYERGVHDHDAALILEQLLRLYDGAGTLRYPPEARSLAQMFWAFAATEEQRSAWATRASSLARARTTFGRSEAITDLGRELGDAIRPFAVDLGLAPEGSGGGDEMDTALAGEYLVEELAATPEGFATSAEAKALLTKFRRAMGGAKAKTRREFDADLRALADPAARYQLASTWISSYVATLDDREGDGVDTSFLSEAVAAELCGSQLHRYDSSATLSGHVEGLLGDHPRVSDRVMTVRIDEFLTRTRRFDQHRVPAYRDYQRKRNELVETERRRLRLSEYEPNVMSGFVRNQLLDEVYLPLIGDNLAKQIGTAGDAKRTDQSGLLLLISPPGYGKTTLMEYVASRLGLVFVKVNGPALGHNVTSLDPSEAPNATARQEVEKISFGLEMANNVLLYLDDIQHTSPELLQKFISLCDSQRRIEGVWNGRTRTYDLRGKRFAVCMAGNPYTEAGQRFRVPDMLANRADVWNLGDVLSGRDKQFALSYIENSLTSNSVLAPVSTRERSDIELLVRLARGDETAHSDQLSHPYSAVELDQILSVLRKVLRVQEVLLTVNQAYIASAAQSDEARTEPPFQLQGSYRNMNRLVERIVPVMNEAELEATIDDHYAGEAQTLTSGAEANLLKLAELRGRLTPEQAERWAEVKAAFLRAKALGGEGDDAMSRAVGAMGHLADQVAGVENAIRAKGHDRAAAE